MQRAFQFSPILSTLWKLLHFWTLKHTHYEVLHFSYLACSLPPQAMSSLDLISHGRVKLGQQVPERIAKQRLGAAGNVSGISVGGILSLGVNPKMTLLHARWIHTCNPSSSHRPSPWRPQAECQVSPPFHRVSINGCWAPHRHQGSVSVTDTCHHAIPLGETHHVGLEMTRSICSISSYLPPAKQNLLRITGKETQGSSPLRMLGPTRIWETQCQD